MSSSASATSTSSASASASSAASGSLTTNSNLKVVGIILAVVSGLLIGSSFVFKKKGLLRSQAGQAAGEGVAYLKSPLWWLGMIMMILGELCNFAAYAFVEAIVVTPLGALSVVVCAMLSSIFLKEKLSFFGWLGCGLCILGSVIIAMNGPSEASVGQIKEFQKLFLAPGFLAYAGVLIAAAVVIVVYFAPRYGKQHMLWYIMVCSMIGGISVSVTTGLGAAIVTTAQGDSQFKYWFIYFLMGFVVITLLTEIYYLNVALALFNTAMVTPTYYVIFTFFSMVTTIVLFKGLSAPANQIITMVMGFLVICVGITILQMSKVDPGALKKLDRRSTMLLQAARSQTEGMDEKDVEAFEEPGIDTLRGSFGAMGSVIRARTARRASQSSQYSYRSRPPGAAAPIDRTPTWLRSDPASPHEAPGRTLSTMTRHQLWDAPVPGTPDGRASRTASTASSQLQNRQPTIKFGAEDVVHQYHPTSALPGAFDANATHEHRAAVGTPVPPNSAYPPPPPSDSGVELLGRAPSGSEDRVQSMVVPVPRAFADEHAVKSAPATVLKRFEGREQLLEPPRTGSMLSFPSVTDSAHSRPSWTLEDDFREGKRDRESSHERRGASHERGRGSKRYPRGADDDDREESVSLWRGSTAAEASDSDTASDEDLAARGGIRLVPSRT
ncbi:magnesium transporter NIPA-domain-containing protein [Schizophyllum amplum]|uniref:Magnesium transporter NIPA-domain-containing protein n=1 Tax=Schizophyllum amplum TaxID=97359 RepID=A0A550CZU3_9AGAR|nr:magnesium transporter NIPA-domain-containing protein [Auriculariopsis ampla]